MGGDGGSIPQRVDMVRMKNKKLKDNLGSLGYQKNTLVSKNNNDYNPKELKEFYFNHCAISQEYLKEPVTCCRLGFLYNKESVLRLLLRKRQNKRRKIPNVDDKFVHIESVEDIVLCKNKLNSEKKLICVLSNEIINPSVGGICIFSCGCIYSKKVFKNISSNEKKSVCVQCNRKYKESDIVEIGVVDESELEGKRSALLKRKKLIKEKKKKKYRERRKKQKEKMEAEVETEKTEKEAEKNKEKETSI